MKYRNKQPLGVILVEAGLITPCQLEIALKEQLDNDLKLGEILALHGWIEQETANFFAESWEGFLGKKNQQPLVFYFRQSALLNSEKISLLLEEQAKRNPKPRFHTLAVESGYIKQITVDFFLAKLFDIYSSHNFSFAKPYEIIRGYNNGQTDFTRTELIKAPLSDLSLKGVKLDGSNLREAEMSRINLAGSSMIQVNLCLANLNKAVLISVNLERAFLDKANLRDTNLEKANFTGASLKDVDLRGAYLFHTSFVGADLQGAKLPSDYPYEVYYSSQTLFDKDFNPKKAGWKLRDEV